MKGEDGMQRAIEIVMNVVIQPQALDAAATGSAIGVVMVADYALLFFGSILALAIVIERSVRLKRSRLLDPALFETVPDKIADGDTAGAIAVAGQSRSVLGRALASSLDEHHRGGVSLEQAMELADEEVDDALHANLDILGTVGKVAPLLGLLGTVLGMMYAFGQLDAGMRKETLAQGITTALDTTVRGLIIAIGCIAFERLFLRRIEHIRRELGICFSRIAHAPRRASSADVKEPRP